MAYFRYAEKTQHYIQEHEKDFHWIEVLRAIGESAKNMRKKGDKTEIETKTVYILGQIEKGIFYIINAKWKR